MKRTSALLTLALTACATEQSVTPPGAPQPGASGSAAAPATPVSERQRVVEPGYLDLGVLGTAPPALPKQVNNDVLLGVEIAAQPLVMECLVDPKSRGPEKLTKVVVDATLVDAGVDHKVTGQNLTPAGTACITAALGKWTAASAGLSAKNAVPGPVTVHFETQHLVGVSPSVQLGVSEASDIAGAIRLALPSWNDCLADWKSAAPRTLSASVKVVRPKPPSAEVTPAEVTFEPAGDPTGDKVAACLKTKVLALKLKPPTSEVITLPYRFRFVHSGIAEASLPGATPDLQFAQLNLQRGRREAERAIVKGERVQTGVAYNAAVDGYKASAKDPKAPKVTVAELTDKCKALLAEDDKLIDALQKVAAMEETTHRFTAEQKAKDPTWADVEAASARNLAEAQKATESMRNDRKADEGACPKVR